MTWLRSCLESWSAYLCHPQPHNCLWATVVSTLHECRAQSQLWFPAARPVLLPTVWTLLPPVSTWAKILTFFTYQWPLTLILLILLIGLLCYFWFKDILTLFKKKRFIALVFSFYILIMAVCFHIETHRRKVQPMNLSFHLTGYLYSLLYIFSHWKL